MRNYEVIAKMQMMDPKAFVSTFTREGKTRDVKRVDFINGAVRITADGDIDGIIPPPPDSRDGVRLQSVRWTCPSSAVR